MFSDILKNEVKLENDFHVSLLYNFRRGSDAFYHNLLEDVTENKLIEVKKYFVSNYNEFEKCTDLLHKKHYDIFSKVKKYHKENNFDVDSLLYIYFKFQEQNFEINKELAIPLAVEHSKYARSSLSNRYNIIINTNENAEDLIKLCLLKDWNLYIISGYYTGIFLYEIIKNDGLLGYMDKSITNYNFNIKQRMINAVNNNPF